YLLFFDVLLLRASYLVFRFFFFQAEDGIRGFHVTGVQTCALPISADGTDLRLRRPVVACRAPRWPPAGRPAACRRGAVRRRGWRSEERRVGKECRSWWVQSSYTGTQRMRVYKNISADNVLCL